MVVDRLYNLLAAEAQTSAQSLSQGNLTQPESPLSNNTWADIATQLDYRAETCPRDHRQEPKKIDLATLLMTGKAAARVPDLDDQVNRTSFQHVSELRSVEVSSKLEARANEQHSQSSLSHSSNKFYDEIIVEATGNIVNSKEKGDTIPTNRETSQEIIKTRTDRDGNSISPVEEEPILPNQSAELTLSDQFQHINPFKRLKRVPRRYVRIHKDQILLLEHKDCWYEQHGSQTRLAAIPPGVLDDLTNFMKPKSDVSQLQGQEPESSSPESEEDTEMDDTVDKKSGSNTADTNMEPVGDDARQLNKRKVIARVSHVESRHFSSSGSAVKDVAVDVDEGTDDDDCTSWEPTPELEKTSNEPIGPRSKPFARMPVTIPSSSPTREEDLEIAIPHAIGDVIEVDDNMLQDEPRISQELPSGASRNSYLIQVEQTPFPKSRGRNHPLFDRNVTANYCTPGNISSDPVIPATFNDTSISDGQISSSTEQKLSTSRAHISATQHQRNDNQEGDAISPPQAESHLVRDEVNRTLTGPEGTESPREPTSLSVGSTSIPASPGLKIPNSEISPPFSQRVPASSPFITVVTPTEELAQPSTVAMNTPNLKKPDKRRLTTPAISMSRRDRKLFHKFSNLNENPASGRKKKDEIMMDALDKIRVAKLQMKKELSEEGFTAAMERPSPPISEQVAQQVIPTIAVDTPKLSTSRCLMSTSPNPHVDLREGLPVDNNTPRDRHTISRTSDSLLPRHGCDDEIATRIVDAEREPSIISRTSSQEKEIADLEVTQSDDATYSIYDKFFALYPAYTGDEKCFIRALVCMEWMNDMGNGLHPFLYDDFVRVFPEYESITRKLPPLHRVTGRRYYDENIKRPLFQHGLITPSNLTADLSTLNPSYVQLVRNKYYAPELRLAESKGTVVSPITAVQAEPTKRDDFVTASRSQSKVLQAEASPELGSGNRFARKPFFETASQLHNVTDEPGVSIASSRFNTGRSDRNSKTATRTLPWDSRSHVQSLSPQKESCSQRSGPPAQTERGSGLAGSRKRHLSTDQTRRATLPPSLRTSFSRSSPHSGRVETHARPESRDSEVFEAPAPQTSTRALNAARLWPELHRYKEKWVTEQPVDEASRTTEMEKHIRKKTVDKAVAARRQSGGGLSKAATLKGQLKSSFSEFVNRRLSSGMLSKASLTPGSTPGKNFCTKRKDTVASMEPDPKA